MSVANIVANPLAVKMEAMTGQCGWWSTEVNANATGVYVELRFGPYKAEAVEQKDGNWKLTGTLAQPEVHSFTTLAEAREHFIDRCSTEVRGLMMYI